MNDVTGYQPKGPLVANPKPPSGGSCIMNHNEAKHIESMQADGERAEELRNLVRAEGGCLNTVPGPDDVVVFPPMKDGYYWAKLIGSDRWQPVWVTGPYVGIIDHDTKEYSHTIADFTFGPRIEEPNTPPPASSEA